MFQFQAAVFPKSNDRLSALYITLLIPSLMQPDVHPWIWMSFCQATEWPLCHVSRLKHVLWKKPSIPFCKDEISAFLYDVDFPIF